MLREQTALVKEQTTLQALLKAEFALAAMAGILSACGPSGVSQDQVQSLVQTSVAAELQNQVGTSVALTVAAFAPAETATSAPTEALLLLPTLTPLATVTPFVVVPAGGGGGSGGTTAKYACTFREVKPLINVFKPGDAIDVVWVITNTGSVTWPSNKDLDFVSGTQFSSYTGQELPALKSGERTTVSFEGNAPTEPGYYEMKFKVEGGLCFPFIDIQVIKPPGQDP